MDVARARQRKHQRGQCRLRAGAHRHARNVQRSEHRREPAAARHAVGTAATAWVVGHEQVGVVAREHLGQPLLQQRGELDALGRRRHVHAQVDARREVDRRRRHEGAAGPARFQQAALLGLGIGAGHGREVHAQQLGHAALRRQPVARLQLPFGNGALDQRKDAQVARALAGAEDFGPCAFDGGSIHVWIMYESLCLILSNSA
jgi:hypothetical protein